MACAADLWEAQAVARSRTSTAHSPQYIKVFAVAVSGDDGVG